jgi:hypothetical protein
MIFKRKVYDEMLRWKRDSDGKSALLIEGARRIGKSTIVEEFAKNEYDDYLLIDFSNVEEEVKDLFNNMTDISYFFIRLGVLFNKTNMPRRKSVIIFDEVQFCPKARQAIKHLVKDGRYDYIETGSLISIKQNVKDILIPSEEERLGMFPMCFEEFMWAIGKEASYEAAKYSFQGRTSLGNAVNRSIMRDFRLYMLIGGMPQAIAEYIESEDFVKVDRIKRNIIDLYLNDFRRIDSTGRVSTIFKSIPSELARNTLRYKVGSVLDNAKVSRMGDLFANIEDSKTVNFAYHANDPSIGLSLHADLDYFKMFTCDTGLFITLAFMDKSFTDNIIYKKLLSDKLPTDLGYVYENVVAQELRSAGHNLFYYTFRDKSGDNTDERTYEVDFLITHGDKICPIEVKSSGYKAHKSLDKFSDKYSSRIAERYLIYTKELRKEANIIYLPVYMTGLL